jgi:hypothetical protein
VVGGEFGGGGVVGGGEDPAEGGAVGRVRDEGEIWRGVAGVLGGGDEDGLGGEGGGDGFEGGGEGVGRDGREAEEKVCRRGRGRGLRCVELVYEGLR